MTSGSRVFISAVTEELKAARQVVAQTLQIDVLGYRPEYMDIFGTQQGDLRTLLRQRIDRSVGVIQIVGECYGAEPPFPDPQFGRVSYTQFEALYAKSKGKPVWYLVPEKDYPRQSCVEPETLQRLQAAYRQRIFTSEQVFHQTLVSNKDIELHILKLSAKFDEARRAARRQFTRLAALVIMLLGSSLGGVAWLVERLVIHPRVTAPSSEFPQAVTRFAGAGSWARDEFIGVIVPNAVAGTILGSEPYQLTLQLRNATSMRTSIVRIVVQSRNQDAAHLFGLRTSQVFEHEIRVPYQLDGGQTASIPLRLNQILPKELTVRVYHTQSGTPSEFVLSLNTVTLPMPVPRRLPSRIAAQGYDSLFALRRAMAEATRRAPEARLIAQFPGTHATFIDDESRLTYLVVENWVATFFVPGTTKTLALVVSPSSIDAKESSGPPDSRDHDLPEAGTLEPVLSYQQAVEVASRHDLLSADWDTENLTAVSLGTASTYAWFLPYRSQAGLPIVLDAVTGEQLLPARDGRYRRVPWK